MLLDLINNMNIIAGTFNRNVHIHYVKYLKIPSGQKLHKKVSFTTVGNPLYTLSS